MSRISSALFLAVSDLLMLIITKRYVHTAMIEIILYLNLRFLVQLFTLIDKNCHVAINVSIPDGSLIDWAIKTCTFDKLKF